MDAKEYYEYAKNTLKGRCISFEKEILKGKWDYHSGWVHLYVKDIIKGRWKELEELYLNSIVIPKTSSEGFYCFSLTLCHNYCKDVIKGRWKEFESKLLDVHRHPRYINNEYGINYCKKIIKGRWEELEKIIINNPYVSVNYCINVINDRWKEAEEIIKKDPHSAYLYAKSVIKGRWKEAEEIIISAKDYNIALWYAKNVVKDRWKEAENIIEDTSPRVSTVPASYKKFILSKITKLIEDKNYDSVLDYVDYKHFTNIIKNLEKKHHIPDVIKNAMIASCLTEKDQNSVNFMKQDKIFREKMKNFLSEYKELSVSEVLEKLR